MALCAVLNPNCCRLWVGTELLSHQHRGLGPTGESASGRILAHGLVGYLGGPGRVIVLGDNGGHRALVDRKLENVRPGVVADDVEVVFAFCDLGEVEIGSDDRFA